MTRARQKYKGIALGCSRHTDAWRFRVRIGRELGVCGLGALPRDWLDAYVDMLTAARRHADAARLQQEWLARPKRRLPTSVDELIAEGGRMREVHQ
jgi:hypothetical protein